MAEATRFGHDRLGHLLADQLMEVPRFQRSYAWDKSNVDEFLSDLRSAADKDVDYFMGTVVFARPHKADGRQQIVDGQQRLATTALLLIAIRDELTWHGRVRQAEEIEKRFLRGYVISMDAEVERLLLSPTDLGAYEQLLDGRAEQLDPSNPLRVTYEACVGHLRSLSPSAKHSDRLISLSKQLEERVQVLVAEASDLPEAYVIFETLNDRGADLTTADLLKNYLFSASKDYFKYVESKWTFLEASFDRPDDLVKFIRYHHVSRHGSVSGRKLYRAIQSEIGGGATRARRYVDDLAKAQSVYLAIRDPDSSYWSNANIDLRHALHAYRRFGFEASMPMLLAAFSEWSKRDACKLLVKVAKWSIRAQVAGRLGGGVADETFGMTARAISDGSAKNQTAVRTLMGRLIPSDDEFLEAFISYGDISTSRAKYLLAMLEEAEAIKSNRVHTPIEWHSRRVTIEHILPASAATQATANATSVNRIGNLALLEKRLNHAAGSKPFLDKRPAYQDSAFELTRKVSKKRTWTARSISARTGEPAELAVRAWPDS